MARLPLGCTGTADIAREWRDKGQKSHKRVENQHEAKCVLEPKLQGGRTELLSCYVRKAGKYRRAEAGYNWDATQ